jgi:hypothetical protein
MIRNVIVLRGAGRAHLVRIWFATGNPARPLASRWVTPKEAASLKAALDEPHLCTALCA